MIQPMYIYDDKIYTSARDDMNDEPNNPKSEHGKNKYEYIYMYI